MNIICQNFFGMNSDKQLLFLNEIINNKNSLELDTFKNFNRLFISYRDKLDFLYKNKDTYSLLNIRQLRYVRCNLYKKLSSIALSHNSNHSKENEISFFTNYYCNEINTPYELCHNLDKYFYPKKINNTDAMRNIQAFRDSDDKNSMVLDLCNNYKYMGFFEFPVEEYMIDEYEKCVKTILDDELYTYYENLYAKEKIDFIFAIAHIFYGINFKTRDEIDVIDDLDVEVEKNNTVKMCTKVL